MFLSPPLLLASVLTLLAATPVRAVDLLSFHDAFGHVLVFTVPNTAPLPATVDQASATQAAVDWARRFYRVDDLDVLAMEFEVRPTRFWRVTVLASGRG